MLFDDRLDKQDNYGGTVPLSEKLILFQTELPLILSLGQATHQLIPYISYEVPDPQDNMAEFASLYYNLASLILQGIEEYSDIYGTHALMLLTCQETIRACDTPTKQRFNCLLANAFYLDDYTEANSLDNDDRNGRGLPDLEAMIESAVVCHGV
jgi:hypothetical protein